MIEVDVAISGAGSAGMALALGLMQQSQLKVALIDPAPWPQPYPETPQEDDSRVIALAKQSSNFLQQLGLSKLTQVACPIEHIQVSEQGGAGQCCLTAASAGLTAMGYVLPLATLNQQLQQALHKATRLQLATQTRIQHIQTEHKQQTLTLANQQQIRCKLLVVAEGAQSATRTLLGIDVQQQAYHQHALVANIQADRAHQQRAFERFCQSGPLAMLPLTSQQHSQAANWYSLVWCLPQTTCQSLQHCPEDEFLANLQNAFGYRAGLLKQVTARQSFPLQLIMAEQLTAHRSLLLGNAAQSLHPVAGQGLNLALRDVADLLTTLCQAPVDDAGNNHLLRAYQQQRQADRSKIITATDALVRVFSNNLWPLKAARNLALIGLAHSPFAQQQFIKQAAALNQGAKHATH